MRRFCIRQERSAMKIGTDGVLLGAWCRLPDCGRVYDIGSGTGLIALMAAQRCECRITGVEIDPQSASEASENVAASPWSDRISVLQGDALTLMEMLPCPDAMVSNPPFFDQQLKSPDERRAGARHEGRLGLDALIGLAAQCLAPAGYISFIAPADRLEEIEMSACMHRLNVQRVCTVRSVAGKRPIRVMVQAGRELTAIERTELCIRDSNGNYTADYRLLTKEFYINV